MSLTAVAAFLLGWNAENEVTRQVWGAGALTFQVEVDWLLSYNRFISSIYIANSDRAYRVHPFSGDYCHPSLQPGLSFVIMLFRPLSILVAAGCLASLSATAAIKKRQVPASHVQHERQLEHLSNHWEKRDRVGSSTLLPMRIGLTQDSLEQGHELLMDMLVSILLFYLLLCTKPGC